MVTGRSQHSAPAEWRASCVRAQAPAARPWARTSNPALMQPHSTLHCSKDEASAEPLGSLTAASSALWSVSGGLLASAAAADAFHAAAKARAPGVGSSTKWPVLTAGRASQEAGPAVQGVAAASGTARSRFLPHPQQQWHPLSGPLSRPLTRQLLHEGPIGSGLPQEGLVAGPQRLGCVCHVSIGDHDGHAAPQRAQRERRLEPGRRRKASAAAHVCCRCCRCLAAACTSDGRGGLLRAQAPVATRRQAWAVRCANDVGAGTLTSRRPLV